MSADIRFMGHGLVVDATQEGQGAVVRRFPIAARPTPEEAMLAALATLTARTHGQLQDLLREPTVERCDLMVRALAEVSTQVHRLGAVLATHP